MLCEVTFGNELTFCSCIHHVRISIAFSQMEKRPGTHGNLDSTVTEEVGGVFYTGLNLLFIAYLYRST